MSCRPLVRCNYCSTESTNQPDGDGCHACLRGVMRRVSQPVMALDFTPQYHFKNASGQWQIRPADPRLAGQIVDEAKRLHAAGEPMASVVDADPAPLSPFFDSLRE